MSLFFQVLASGSKGNAVLICSSKTRLLLDAGLSGKELARRLDKTPATGRQLDALLLSHEHQDHTRGAGVISRRFDLPVYLSQGTLENISPQTGQLTQSHLFQPGVTFSIGDLKVQPFAISHDAGEPCGFVIEHAGFRLGICTDLGIVTELVRVRLQECHGLILEANHDVNRLMDGPYPWHLKQRIRSRHGHLSNEDTIELLRTLHHDRLQSVLLAHLSETNNHPDLVRKSFQGLCQCPEWESIRFEIGRQHDVTPGVELI